MARKRLRTRKHPPNSASRSLLPVGFADLLGDVKQRIQAAQTRAMTRVNAELVRLYWDIGGLIEQRQQQEGWGASVIPKLSAELRNDLPELKGFSERNIKSMLAFYRAYPAPERFVQQPVAQLAKAPKSPQTVAKTQATEKAPQAVAQLGAESLLWQIPWGHHVCLLQKVKDLPVRL